MGRFVSKAAVVLALVGGSSAWAATLASDDFQTSAYSLGSLNGQTVGGTGFTGTWTREPALNQDLYVIGGGLVGRPGSGTYTAAGNYATFATPINLNSGQLFISYTINNPGTPLASTRLDLNANTPPASPMRIGLGGDAAGQGTTPWYNDHFGFHVEWGLGQAFADSGMVSTGLHHLVGVLDYQNHQIAIFVDPSRNTRFYNPDGTNNANGVAAWTPVSGLSFSSYSLIENLDQDVTFSGVTLSTDAAAAGVYSRPVPVPAALWTGSALLAGLGLMRLRRRNAARM